MPRSRSRSFESMTRSATASLARKVPAWRSMASTRVVLPWSTWAMMAMLRIVGAHRRRFPILWCRCRCVGVLLKPAKTRPVQFISRCFCRRLRRLPFGTADVTLDVGILVATQRTHVVLPQELITEIDAIVGPRGRSAFIAETVKAELRRRWWLNYLADEEPIMKDEDHPEFANGTKAWLDELRRPWQERVERIIADGLAEEKKAG